MRKKFVTNLALVIVLNMLVKPFWIFGIDRTVQNEVGVEAYGFYFALFNFSLLLNIVLDLGLTNFNNRNIAQHNQLLSKHLSNLVVLKLVLGIAYFLISLGIAVFVLNYELPQTKLLVFLLFNQFLLSFILYLRSNLAGLHLFKTDSFISVLDRILLIIICSFLLWGQITDTKFQIEWLVYAQTFSYLLTAVITFFIVVSKTNFIKLRVDLKFFIVILKHSYPFALLTLLMMFYIRVDAVMLERLLDNGNEQAGIYAQSYRILDAASMFAYLFAGLLLPIFSKMIKQKESVNKLVLFSFLLLIVPAFTVSITSFYYSKPIMDMLYHNHAEASSQIFKILILCFIPISTTYIFGTLLTANGNMKVYNIMAAIGAVSNAILNLILIPRYQALGSAMATLITQGATAFAQVLIAKKIFNFHLTPLLAFKLFFYSIGVCALGFFIYKSDLYWIFGASLIVVLSLIIAFGLKLINLKELFFIFKEKN